MNVQSPGNSYQQPDDSTSDFNVTRFLIQRMLARVRTATLVQVKTVTTSGAVAPAGFVDAVPMINMVDGKGNAFPHTTIYNLPYFRLQGGQNAVILDPVVGEMGLAVICDRDITSVKNTLKTASPPTQRRFDLADGIYFGGLLGASAPTQFIQFAKTGINLVDVNNNQIQMGPTGIVFTPASGVLFVNGSIGLSGNFLDIDGQRIYQGNIRTAGEVTAKSGTSGSVSVSTHTHTQGVDSHNDIEAPTNAPTGGT